MIKDSYERKTCRLCDSNDLIIALKLKPSPLADSYTLKMQKQKFFRLDWMLCRKCGNVQLRDIVNPKLIYINYLYKTVSSLGLVNHFKTYAQEVTKKIKPPNGSLIVDIGSNDGSLLKFFKLSGMRVLGIDPAKEIAEEATKRGITTIPSFFTDALATEVRKKYGQASIITANNLVANIDDLDNFISAVKLLMGPESVFIFESFYLLDIMKNMVFDCTYHEHLNYFSVGPVQKFFEKHDMELIDSQSVDTKGGSVRYILQMKSGKRQVSASVQNHIANEKNYGLTGKRAFISYSKKISKAKKITSELLSPFIKDTMSVIAFGASASSTTLLYEFDLVNKLKYFIDDNPAKYNTFCPGSNLPVYRTEFIKNDIPDLVVILAWRYAKDVISKHSKLFSKQTKFLIPLPEPTIVSLPTN